MERLSTLWVQDYNFDDLEICLKTTQLSVKSLFLIRGNTNGFDVKVHVSYKKVVLHPLQKFYNHFLQFPY